MAKPMGCTALDKTVQRSSDKPSSQAMRSLAGLADRDVVHHTQHQRKPRALALVDQPFELQVEP